MSNLQGLSDEELLNELKNGNTKAFDQIYNRHWKNLYIYTFNVLQNKELCEDIVQEVFVGLYKNIQKTTIAQLKGYLFKSAKFQIIKQIKKSAVRNKYLEQFNKVLFVNETEDSIHFQELESSLNQAISQLPEKCREIFILSKLQGQSHQEIAQSLSISVQTVKNQLSKALRILRDDLKIKSIITQLFILIQISLPVS